MQLAPATGLRVQAPQVIEATTNSTAAEEKDATVACSSRGAHGMETSRLGKRRRRSRGALCPGLRLGVKDTQLPGLSGSTGISGKGVCTAPSTPENEQAVPETSCAMAQQRPSGHGTWELCPGGTWVAGTCALKHVHEGIERIPWSVLAAEGIDTAGHGRDRVRAARRGGGSCGQVLPRGPQCRRRHARHHAETRPFSGR
mmetsp:Transcript_60284/g.168371  ORF Transcript_60284/g.168371 Transcript_60284/m.168371 type:complete len:200 (-) Transcript_60284:36-635(-)